jgi:DNA-binding beta-propeller fold protein YncE
MKTLSIRDGWRFAAAAVAALALSATAFAAVPPSLKGLMYIGTLDQKLLVIKEDSGDIAGEIQLGGIPRTTVLSADGTKVHIITTKMQVETVDLLTRQVITSFPLADPRSSPRMMRNAGGRSFSGIAVDPGGRYLYTGVQVTVKEIDQYRLDPPQFVTIDLQEKKIAKSIPFPKGYDQGFGFGATYKISPDGKLLYVFDDDIVVFDLSDLHEVDRIALAKPEYPGASPYRLAASDDPNDDPEIVTSIFTSVDPIVHKETIGMAKLNLTTHKVEYKPIGPAFPMVGFMLTPDRKLAYSLMVTKAGANRDTEWWVWDVEKQTVIRKAPVTPRINFRPGMSSDGQTLYLFGGGSTIEFWDANTLQAKRMLYLNKDSTTNLITIAGR